MSSIRNDPTRHTFQGEAEGLCDWCGWPPSEHTESGIPDGAIVCTANDIDEAQR